MRTMNFRALAVLSCLIFGLPACSGDTVDEAPESERNETGDGTGGRPSRPDTEAGESEGDDAPEPVQDAGSSADALTEPDAGQVQDVIASADASRDAGDSTPDVREPAPDVQTADAGNTTGGQDCTSSDANRYACCVLEQVNLYRERNGLPAYQWNVGVSETAFYYADYMAQNRVFAHSADGMNFGERLDEFDVPWASAGENLQRNDLSLWNAACNETVNGRGGWVNSRNGHREAMLGQDASGTDKQWTHAAAGIARNGNEWYVAMYFVRF
jgi:uncharacterized protein YkwD